MRAAQKDAQSVADGVERTPKDQDLAKYNPEFSEHVGGALEAS